MAKPPDTPRTKARKGKPPPASAGGEPVRTGKASVEPDNKPEKSAPVRRPPRQTFLVAATLAADGGAARLGVYAVVTRTPAEALAALHALLGPDVPVGLTGKLSGRMAKALGLKPGEVRRISSASLPATLMRAIPASYLASSVPNDELSTTLSARETYHIEILGSDAVRADEAVLQRVSVRSAGLDGARERALRLFARARTPQRSAVRAEAVRVIDGAGREVFRWSRFDEPGG